MCLPLIIEFFLCSLRGHADFIDRHEENKKNLVIKKTPSSLWEENVAGQE